MIGLDDLPQAIFRTTVAPVGIRVQAFDQFLIAGLDFLGRLMAVKIEGGKGFPLEVLERPPLRLGGRPFGPESRAKQVERVNDVLCPGHVRDQLHLTGYRNVAIELSTHAIGGLSENDFILAAKINELPIELKKS